MDLDDAGDLLMNEADILASTEPFTQPAVLLASVHNGITGSSVRRGPTPTSSIPPALKGSGIKVDRSLDSILDPRQDRPRPAKFSKLPYATAQTGLVYDVRMRFHVEAYPTDDDVHPEDPRRIHAIYEALRQAGLVWSTTSESPSSYYMGRIDAREVTEEEARLVHTKKHWDWIASIADLDIEQLGKERQHEKQDTMDSVYLSTNTPLCARLSAGGAIEACRAIMQGKVKNVFANIRPPGHHAEREDVKGFCFFDNVSIATKVCQSEYGEKCRKVLILDWDVHHGNGIQQANYDDPNVLYISLHVHKNGHFYPEGSYRDQRMFYGDHLHCGEGTGLGTNVNIPWRTHGMGDADYIYAFQQVVMPIATEFDPDLVIIAAGFDAADGDMLGGCHVTPAGYAHMTHMLMSLADGKVAVCLEGGYNLDSIARSAVAVVRTLMGEPPDRLQEVNPTKTGVDDTKLVLRQQSKFWSCLYPKDMSERLAGPQHGERMHDVVRKWQATTLWEEHEMSPLFIHRRQLSKSFEDQVLATPNYMDACPLLVILHDPPEVLASPDPRTGRIDLHNTWLTYVSWAISQGFAVIDVNLPKHVTSGEDSQEHEDTDDVVYRTSEATQLLTYLWENYIEVNESTHVFLMGTNIGHGAIINFIKGNEDRAEERLTRAISFVEDVPFQSCRSATNEDLAKWYYGASLVFVGAKHDFWTSEYARKPKKRFGRMSKSEEATISDMLMAHIDEVTRTLANDTVGWRTAAVARPAVEEVDVVGITTPEPQRAPPVANFALSPRAQDLSTSAAGSPLRGGTRSPRASSPPKMPPMANLALARNGQPRSPAR
ncbi:Histone deacetylase hda1 [Recurvomyces mirabilis]|uniref:Histone deacetylase hda1 n=1 Tax=Recurvomyces mirabilis TaxID=574656 RepID=UPI002DDF7969|nr:Histone deacetylase hda1 [Recurvomyces mirabilis]